MVPQPPPQEPRVRASPSLSKRTGPSRRATFREYVTHRWWLGALAIFMVAIMVIGIIFAAHGYYKALGGQGFLKVKRGEESLKQGHGALVYLPLRKVEVPVDRSGFIGRRKNVPYYTCGDQRNSCRAFDQPVSQYDRFVESNLTHMSGHMLPSHDGLLQSEVYAIWNFLL